MDTALPARPASVRAPLSALARWTVATLLACFFLMAYMQFVLVGGFDPPVLPAFGLPALLFALPVVFFRRRWVPLFGALFWALFLAANGLYLAHDLAHPEFRATFMFSVVLLATAVVGLAAGAGAAAARTSSRPRWFGLLVVTISGLCAGAMLVAALPRASAGVDPATLAGLPALTTAQVKFDQPELHAQAGETLALRLENQDASGHSFDIDELNIHVSMPSGQPTLALFTPAAAGTYVFYCSVPGHREAGMKGLLIVAP